MRLPLEWLREFVETALDPDALADGLTMGGLEVEDSVPVAPPFSNVRVARLVSVERHPNADRLTVCKVDAGTGSLLNIVCGAPNAAAGITVPCALPGAVLPGDLTIKATRMRGVASEGMLCSARELGLSDDASGLLILDPATPVGADLREALGLDDVCFEIKLTPNRGDCLSVLGVAREVAALTGAPLKSPTFAPMRCDSDERLPVRIEAPDLCGRFSGRVIRGVDARAATPDWMKRRLERSGQRPISALVDISNYVMLELGRPTHVFDLDKVHAPLTVRWGRPGERLELLNGQTVELDPAVGVIADGRGVESLAGIMGGESTAVSLDTRNVYVEAAFWWPEAIQGRSRRFNFATDAGYRFERGVDFATTVDHIERITRLIVDICGTAATRVGPVDDNVTGLPARAPVRLRPARLRRVLGGPIGDDRIAQCLQRLGLALSREPEAFVVTPPSFRFDLQIEEDLIEEVARIDGYQNLPAEPPRVPATMLERPEGERDPHDLRRIMAEAGFQELVNFSFVDPEWEADFGAGPEDARLIRVVNPIANQYAVMRTTLLGGLVAALRYNLNRQAARVRMFELGRVYWREPGVADGALAVGGIAQPVRLAALAYGAADDEQWGIASRPVDFFDLKADIERLLPPQRARFVPAEHPALHPGRSARIDLDGRAIGWLGELHPRALARYELPTAPTVFELDLGSLLKIDLPQPRPVPRFPAVVRDIALWVDAALPAQRVLDEIDALAQRDPRLSALREVRLFDVFRPDGENSRPDGANSRKFAGASANVLLNKEKSLAFRVVLQDTQRSLADADADAARAAIVDHLTTQLGARARQ